MSDVQNLAQQIHSGRKPKFVPWEPYKGATCSLVPADKGNEQKKHLDSNARRYYVSPDKIIRRKSTKSLLQMAAEEPTAQASSSSQRIPIEFDLPPADPTTPESRDTRSPVSDTLNSQLQREKTYTDRAQLEDQLKTQIEINAELRRLLVSTMGDDVQEYVKALSEDKTHLARSIEHYAHTVGKHVASIDDLLIDADLWRSKFLASSVMCDELIAWRVNLVNKFEAAQQVISQQYHQQRRANESMLAALDALTATIAATAPWMQSSQNVKTLTSDELIAQTKATAQIVAGVVHSKQQRHQQENSQTSHVSLANSYHLKSSPLEERALELLRLQPHHWLAQSSCSDEVSAATASERQMRLLGVQPNCRYKNLTITCCRRCKGNDIIAL